MNCIRCHATIPPSAINTNALVPCAVCGAKIRVDLFPAAFKPPETMETSEILVVDNDAGCFYHPGKKAVVHCDSCGRFLCTLCDVDMGGEHLCFSCLEAGKKKKKRMDLVNQRTIYDDIALRLAVYPMLLFWITIVTAPAALFIAIRHYKTPSSIIPRTRIRFWIAGFLATAQIIGWVAGLYSLITTH